MKIYENISLRAFNSFGVEVRAARLVEWTSTEDLREIVREMTNEANKASNANETNKTNKANNTNETDNTNKGPVVPLGGGNNILFTRDFEGTLLKSVAKEITVTHQTPDKVSVRAEAGVDWADFVEWCTSRGLWGAENLSGIPGTVGAAPIQNIGAYGAEAADIVASVECFGLQTGSVATIAAAHCGFGYRDSVFKRALRGRVVVTAVNFTLSREPRPRLEYAALAEMVARGRSEAASEATAGEVTPAEISRAVIDVRASKLPDPREMGSAGSFFKNPVVDAALAARLAADYPDMPIYPAGGGEKDSGGGSQGAEEGSKLSAGWLIEHAGWRGRSEGRVGIYPRQALIVVNLGGATGSEICAFAERVRADVEAKFGVALTPEVNIW